MKYGDIIKAGYHIQVTTWENDADYYKTNEIHTESLEEVKQWFRIIRLFKSKNNYKDRGFGNQEFNEIEYDFMEALVQDVAKGHLTHEFVKTNFGLDIDSRLDCEAAEIHNESEINDNNDYVVDMLQRFLGRPYGYDLNFCRVVDNVKVVYLETDIKIPEPTVLKSYDLSYAKDEDLVW